MQEGRHWLDRALRLNGPVPDDARAEALWSAGILALNQNDVPASIPPLREALEKFRAAGDTSAVSATLAQLGPAVGALGDVSEAEMLLETGILFGRKSENAWGTYVSLLNLARLLRRQAKLASAKRAQAEALHLGRAACNWAFVASALVEGGHLALAEGDVSRAEDLYREGAAQAFAVGFFYQIPETLEAMAKSAVRRGNIARAVRLGGAASCLREEYALQLMPEECVELDRHRRFTQEHLGTATWERLWQEGRWLSLDQMMAYAMERS